MFPNYIANPTSNVFFAHQDPCLFHITWQLQTQDLRTTDKLTNFVFTHNKIQIGRGVL